MYTYYNAHPKGKLVGDCVKRAITKATGMDYMEVQRELNRYKKVTGAKAFNSDYNPHKYVENVLHGTKISFPAEKGKSRMNGERFCREHPRGNFILNMAGHWTCCVDGIIYDTWDPSQKCVYTAYKVQRVDAGSTFRVVVFGTCYQIELLKDGEREKLVRVDNSDYRGYRKCLEDLGYREI